LIDVTEVVRYDDFLSGFTSWSKNVTFYWIVREWVQFRISSLKDSPDNLSW